MAAVAFVGLGSNLSDPVSRVRAATDALAALPDVLRIRCSSLYRSAPIGEVSDQPDFVNAVCRIETHAGAEELMQSLLAIEQTAGRVRNGRRGGPRLLDLDLLLYDTLVCERAGLILPHPRLHERAFVLYPLHELEPALTIPGHGAVTELLTRCVGQSIERLPDAKTKHRRS